MNTIWVERAGVHDCLATLSDLDAWLGETGLTSPEVAGDAGALQRAHLLRDALRCLAALTVNDWRPPAVSPLITIDEALAVVNATADLDPTRVRLERTTNGFRRVTDSSENPTLAALTLVAKEAVELFSGELGKQLRACQAPGCVLYFVKNHGRREWCSNACGNRARAARHYRKLHNGSSAQ
jgi:hypothetical protein